MKSLYTNKCLQRLYTPLTYEESLPHVNEWYARNKTAFNKSVIVIKSISTDGVVNYTEKEMKPVYSIPAKTNEQGGESIPVTMIMVNEVGVDSKLKKGRLVYNNSDVIINNSSIRPIQLWTDKYIPYELTAKNEIYPVISDGWTPYCATNLGKYGTWDLEEIKKKRNL